MENYRTPTGVNLAGDAGDTSPPIFWLGGRQREYPSQYYYVLLDIADQHLLPSVCSASSRFHSAIRRHQFASVRQADSRPPNLELALTPLRTPRPVFISSILFYFTLDVRKAIAQCESDLTRWLLSLSVCVCVCVASFIEYRSQLTLRGATVDRLTHSIMK